MVEIKNLTKIYNENKKNGSKALNDVSFTLPDTGLVFIVGKSGSGKSTLLNLLGCLDDITSGDIVINGTSISKLSNKKLDEYRGNYIGIIYQNYCLFENQSVLQNIRNSVELTNTKLNTKQLDDLLTKIDIQNKKNTLVKNLSGGQKQRVAIARALIKNPELILADEPTGNLDSKSSKTIFEILKEISRTKLVVVISHDNESARQYADRIITLADGQIVEDVDLNSNFIEEDENTILLNNKTVLSDEKIRNINTELAKHGLKVQKVSEKFVKHIDVNKGKHKTLKIKNKTKTLKPSFMLSKNFFKTSIASFVLTVLISTFLIGLLSLSHSFINFDFGNAISKVATSQDLNIGIFNKAYSYYDDPTMVNKQFAIPIEENDIEKFREAGYSGNIYKIYNTTMYNYIGDFEKGKIYDLNGNYSRFWCGTGLGTIVCDYDYLTKIFGNENGEVEMIAGSIDDTINTVDLIVTDYYADSVLEIDRIYGTGRYIPSNPDNPYEKIFNTGFSSRFTIGAIIKTDYKEKYSEILELLNRMELEPQNANIYQAEIVKNTNFKTFIDEANAYLNFSYSINPNFRDDFIINQRCPWTHFKNMVYTDRFGKILDSIMLDNYGYVNNSLNQGECLMNIEVYNQFFNKSLTIDNQTDFTEETVILNNFQLNESTTEPPKSCYVLKIVGVYDGGNKNNVLHINKNDFKKLQEDWLFNYALAFDNMEELGNIESTLTDNYYYPTLSTLSSVFVICNIVKIFEKIFSYIAIIVIILIAVIIISHYLRIIKKNQYHIGVYRSLGYTISTISIGLVLNGVLLSLLISATSILFVYFSSYFINSLVVDSFIKFLHLSILNDLVLVNFSMPILSIYLSAIALVGIFAVVIPIVSIRKIKPNKIIRNAT